jgi:hypothetical protein
MSEPQNHQEMVDSFKKQIIEINHEIDRQIDQGIGIDQLSRLALLSSVIANLCSAGSTLEYIDGKISISALIDTLDANLSDYLVVLDFLKKVKQENELN